MEGVKEELHTLVVQEALKTGLPYLSSKRTSGKRALLHTREERRASDRKTYNITEERIERRASEMELHARHQTALDEFLRRALENYGERIERIILFGSVARGDAREESDIEILVVTTEEDFRLRRALTGLAFDILLETGEDISVKALAKADFERGKNFSFVRYVVSEGVQVA